MAVLDKGPAACFFGEAEQLQGVAVRGQAGEPFGGTRLCRSTLLRETSGFLRRSLHAIFAS